MEYRGIQWKDKRDLSKKLHKCESYVSGCLRRGDTYEIIIDTMLDSYSEYRGIEWSSNSELSEKLYKSSSYVSSCLNQGKTYEEIIDYVLDKRITKYLSEEVILKLNTKGGF